MQKFRFLIIALAICLLLSSCATTRDLPPDMVITPPENHETPSNTENQLQNGDYRTLISSVSLGSGMQGMFFNNLLYTSRGTVINLETREMFSACSDPLCDHSGWPCANLVLMASDCMVISPNSAADDLVFYLANTELVGVGENHQGIFNHRILRYHFYTGDLTVLAEHLPSAPVSISIDPQTENLFFQQRVVNEAGETEVSTYILNGKTGKLKIIPTFNMSLSVTRIIGDVVYLMNYKDGTSYSIDLSQKEPALMEAEPMLNGSYLFYEDNPTEVQVPVPDELLPLCEEYGKEPYKIFTKSDLYRVIRGDESATPVLVAKDVMYSGYSGDYVFYCEFDPKYVTAYYLTYYYNKQGARQYQTYPLGTVDLPQNVSLIIEFEPKYAPIHVLDAETLEEVAVIASEGYYIDLILDLKFVNDGAFVTWRYLDPQMYLTSMTGGSDEVQETFGYLYFDKHDLTYEDTIVFDMP